MPPRDEVSCVHTGVMWRGFEAHAIEGTCEFSEPVSGTTLHPIEGIIEDTQFNRLAKWEAYGVFDDGGF